MKIITQFITNPIIQLLMNNAKQQVDCEQLHKHSLELEANNGRTKIIADAFLAQDKAIKSKEKMKNQFTEVKNELENLELAKQKSTQLALALPPELQDKIANQSLMFQEAREREKAKIKMYYTYFEMVSERKIRPLPPGKRLHGIGYNFQHGYYAY